MNRLLLFTFLTLSTSFVFAQRPKTLIGDGIEYTSGFGGFMLQFPTIDGDVTSMTGGGGAVILNNQFYIGGYGLGIADDKRVTDQTGTEFQMDFSHGGLFLGYVVLPNEIVHLDIGTKVGWGQISFNESGAVPGPGQQIEDNVFVVNPTVSAEINMTTWFKFNAGLGFQFANGVDNFYYQSNDFNGLTYNLSLLFGWFK